MKKIFVLATITLLLQTPSFAQQFNDDANLAGNKKYSQYVGVQINELIRQVFNFNNSTTSTTTNPYLLVYSINNAKTGWGLRLGVGYNYQSFTTDDGSTRKTTNINDISARLGIEKVFNLSNKWKAGVGLDAVMLYNDDKTDAVVRTSFDTTTTNTKSLDKRFGGGGMGWLRYQFAKNIFIGTEASFYYRSGTQAQTIDITAKVFTGSSTGYYQTTETINNVKSGDGTLSLPISFYLLVRF